MKSVIISIQPQWCEPISTGLKFIEIRKTRPTVELPIKVYIYATKSDKYLLDQELNGNLFCWDKKSHHYPFKYEENFVGLYNGKVIGEFICDRIDEYESEFVNNDCYETIEIINRETETKEILERKIMWDNQGENFYYEPDSEVIFGTCVSYKNLKKYIGLGVKTFYGWHISDLVIYDEPKELGEFSRFGYIERGCACVNSSCKYHHDNGYYEPPHCELYGSGNCSLERPPQSWGYVEEL